MRLPRPIQGVLDLCYPSICAGCDCFIDGGAVLCQSCDGHLNALASASACPQCAMPAASDGAPCAYCHNAGVAHFERVFRLGIFEDPIKHLIHQMKYRGRWPLAEFLADRLLATERTKGLLTETQVLVPVPLHLRRHITRGYNQADVIARRIGKKARLPVVHAIRRTRNTETQINLHSHAKRVANVRDAFALRRVAKKLRDKHVVVIDDVSTSGATLNAMAQVLEASPAREPVRVVIAIADPKHRGFEGNLNFLIRRFAGFLAGVL